MIRLEAKQISEKLAFIDHYIQAQNAADGSKMDANANVTQKNIATMENELMKDFFVQINRAKISEKIAKLFDKETACEYLRQIEAHEIYVHDETSLKPYCVSVTMYPFLRDGLTKLGANPKHQNIWLLFVALLSILFLRLVPNLPELLRPLNFLPILTILPVKITAKTT